MRISTLLVGLTAAAASVSAALDKEKKPSLVHTEDDYKIPGDSPLELCHGDHNDDIIVIDKVDLLPNPPAAGQQLLIKASGKVKEEIEEGAYVNIVVKYGLIKLLSQKADLCEQIQNVEMECPISEGSVEIEKVVELPNEIPPGKYTVFADVYTKDDEPITCLTATVVFSIHHMAENVADSIKAGLGIEL